MDELSWFWKSRKATIPVSRLIGWTIGGSEPWSWFFAGFRGQLNELITHVRVGDYVASEHLPHLARIEVVLAVVNSRHFRSRPVP
jgi:hypothetical protein